MLEFIDVSKTYKGGIAALRDISFEVKEGEFVAVIGPSGAGKSTLLRLINRLIPITGGRILFDNQDVTAMNNKELRGLRKRVGMIFQQYNLVDRLSVIENALHGLLGSKGVFTGSLAMYSEDEKAKALEVLSSLGLSEQVYQRCADLSGGQKQRVGIARSLMQEPSLLLADEPISSLDPRSSESIMEHLRDINQDGITCLVNLHQVEFALKYATRLIGINRGVIVFNGPPDQITQREIEHIYEDSH